MSELYGLTPEMELLVLRYCATDPNFWRRVGMHVDPVRMAHPQAKMILGATLLHTKESGSHPSSTVIVTQRVQRLHAQGKIKAEAVMAVSDTFDAADDLGSQHTADAVAAELVPLVRRVMHEDVVLKAADEYARRGNFAEVQKLLETATGLGEERGQIDGVAVDASSLDVFDAELPDLLPTGIAELDAQLDGGVPVKSLVMWMGDSGGGKSIALASHAAFVSRLGLHVVVATLELSKQQQLARIAANHTGHETNAIMTNPVIRAKVREALEQSEGQRGPCYVAEFDPGVTTPEDIAQLVEEREQATGRHVDALVVDYGDKLTAKTQNKQDGEYQVMRRVWEGLRDGIARKGNRWVYTASQPKGRRDEKQRQKKLDMHDTADSIHKVRVSDLVLTINPMDFDQLENFEIFVAKNRGNRARYSVGPIYGDFARGRITSSV